jgi:hypothetical protein
MTKWLELSEDFVEALNIVAKLQLVDSWPEKKLLLFISTSLQCLVTLFSQTGRLSIKIFEIVFSAR